jgi:hypothetical protein
MTLFYREHHEKNENNEKINENFSFLMNTNSDDINNGMNNGAHISSKRPMVPELNLKKGDGPSKVLKETNVKKEKKIQKNEITCMSCITIDKIKKNCENVNKIIERDDGYQMTAKNDQMTAKNDHIGSERYVITGHFFFLFYLHRSNYTYICLQTNVYIHLCIHTYIKVIVHSYTYLKIYKCTSIYTHQPPSLIQLLLMPFWLVSMDDSFVTFVVIYLSKHHHYHHYKQHHHYKHHHHHYKNHHQYLGHIDGSVCCIPTAGMCLPLYELTHVHECVLNKLYNGMKHFV